VLVPISVSRSPTAGAGWLQLPEPPRSSDDSGSPSISAMPVVPSGMIVASAFATLMKPRIKPSRISVAGLPNHSPAIRASSSVMGMPPSENVTVPADAE
jgi:hypothetical protein